MAQSIRIIGWSTALFSIIFFLSEVFHVLTNPMEELGIILQMFPQAKSSMDAMSNIIQYSHIWSVYMMLYFLVVFVGSIKFIQFRAIGRMIFEIACWIGMLNACIDSLLSYFYWKQMQAALSTMMQPVGMSLGNFNPLGTGTIILGFFLWIILSGCMIVYLRKPALKALMK